MPFRLAFALNASTVEVGAEIHKSPRCGPFGLPLVLVGFCSVIIVAIVLLEARNVNDQCKIVDFSSV